MIYVNLTNVFFR